MTKKGAGRSAPPATAETRADGLFPIVGIGASAGGLEAFTQLLKAMPADTGMAFVFVQHLAPTHVSALAEILSRATPMPVMEVQDDLEVEPNHVYVIPPGHDMVIARGRLQLLPRQGRGAHRPVDQFLRALAEDQQHQAIGVVLSGTGTDGTIGLDAIKAEGGITFAQDDTAQHDGMPQSAIAAGCVDFVLPPDAIAHEIARIGQLPHVVLEADAPPPIDQRNLAPVLQVLGHATGVDFTHYKFNTLYRRITRRLVLLKIGDLQDYVQLLRQNPEEVKALYHDILISVTSFFRNPEAFDVLKAKVFPRLVRDRSRHDPVRIWSLGCSTGQEAYSLAIAFSEFAESDTIPLQVFATDLVEQSVDTARAGVYSKDIAQDVSPERLRRFFVEVDAGYQITKRIRDVCVFSRHNVLADPPFSRIDLISCRNLLIYLEPVLQQQIMPILHYALKPSGFLWLGGSETIGGYRNLFEPENTKHKIYARKPGPHGAHFPLQHGGAARAGFTPIAARPAGAGTDLHREADRLLLSKFAPPSVLVSADLDILHYRGDTGPYLAPAPGKASLNLLKMLREGLLVGVRGAILRAGKERAPAREEGLRVTSDGGDREVVVEVLPLTGNGGRADGGGGFLILFDEAAGAHGPRATRGAGATRLQEAPASDHDGAHLAQELSATREYLQSVIEQQEAANEELQSANEEVQSANEELQSINEELETSKEEIQSSNEELATVNEEMNNRNVEMTRLNNDLNNLIGSVQVAIVIVGPDLRVRRFTPVAEKLLNLMPADVGRPLVDVRLPFDDLMDLGPLLTEVIDTVSVRERDIRDEQGRWYSLRLRPYRTLDHKVDGVVVMLVDVDVMKRAHEATERLNVDLRESEQRYRNLFNSMDEGYCIIEMMFDEHEQPVDYRFVEVNPAFEKQSGMHEATGKRMREFVSDIEAHWLVNYGHVALTGEPIRFANEYKGLGGRWFDVYAFRVGGPDSRRVAVLFSDIKTRKEADIAVRESEQHLRTQAESLSEGDDRKNEFLAMLAHELRGPLAPIRNAVQIIRHAASRRHDSPENQAIRSASDMMERQTGQMVRLVDDLLDVSRVSRGKTELRRVPLDLASVVNHAVEASQALFDSGGLTLVVTMPPNPIYVNGDSARMIQVIGNLLNNAAKFTPQAAGVWLTVELDNGHAVIRVRDSGIGIGPEDLSRVFELFVQVDTSLERTRSGLGIGLTLAKNLVELHDGTIAVHSGGLGQGTEFVVRLPVLMEPPTFPPSADSANSEGVVTAPRRILVVDDNQDSVASLAMLLTLRGHEVRMAHDGLEAVQVATTFKPDVVLLDIGLPKVNGYEAALRIRNLPSGGQMLLVAVTGWGQEADRRRSAEAGFDAHLVKPIDPEVLAKLIADVRSSTEAPRQ